VEVVERKITMMRVVKYYDLRPVDWASGKRVPLPAGECHVCDRCGAEHAVVYVVEDTESGKTYSVGATCARATWGFDVEKDRESRSLVKEAKRRDAALLDATRQDMITAIIPVIDLELSKIPLREFESDTERYPGITCWHYGDSKALAQGRSDEATRDVAFLGWVQNRIRELVPSEWYKIEVLYEPRSRSRTLISMGRKAEILALAYLRSH
jgi:hypothetical protein